MPELTAKLKAINEKLWGIEDDIRDCECHKDVGPRFIELARAVYFSNDIRAALKRQINDLLNSLAGRREVVCEIRLTRQRRLGRTERILASALSSEILLRDTEHVAREDFLNVGIRVTTLYQANGEQWPVGPGE